MARIRSIKPEFPQSETIGRLSRDARLLFIMLWTVVDDFGRTRAASRMLASLLFPYDDDAGPLIDGWLEELEREECVRRYQVDGASYLYIPNWLKHQKIDHAAKKSNHPPPPEFASPREPSRALAPDLGSRTKEEDTSSLRSDAAASAAPTDPVYTDAVHELFGEGVPALVSLGLSDRKARAMIGSWRKQSRENCAAVLGAIIAARDQRVADPIPFITASLKPGNANVERRDQGRQAPSRVGTLLAALAEQCGGTGGDDLEPPGDRGIGGLVIDGTIAGGGNRPGDRRQPNPGDEDGDWTAHREDLRGVSGRAAFRS
jgi:hypothetical protein